MNRFKLLAFFFAALIVTSFSSCSKDDDAEPTKKDLLTAGQWTGYKIYMAGQDVTDEFKEELDYDMTKNILKYEKSGTYTDTYERTTTTGKWEFADNEQKIIHDKGTADEFTVTIKALSSKQFISTQQFDYEGQAFVIESEYKR